MFNLLLSLHVSGALMSILIMSYGLYAAVRRKGNLRHLRYTTTTTAVYQLATGLGLVLVRPSGPALTRFCAGGIGLLSVYAVIYYCAKMRISAVNTATVVHE